MRNCMYVGTYVYTHTYMYVMSMENRGCELAEVINI